MSADIQTYAMELTRIFDAPPEQIWKAWSEAALVRQWWGPRGFSCPLAEMDFREGGTSLVCMRAPAEYGGGDLYNTWTYTRIVPGERIEFVQRFSDSEGNPLDPGTLGLPPGIPQEVLHRITFKALNRAQTELSVTEFGYTAAEVVEISRSGMVECLDKMAESLQERE